MREYEVMVQVTKTWRLRYEVDANSPEEAQAIVERLEAAGDLYDHESVMDANARALPGSVRPWDCWSDKRDVFPFSHEMQVILVDDITLDPDEDEDEAQE